MKFTTLLLCEAAAIDGRGAHVIVGANMNVIESPTDSTVVQRQLYVVVTDDDDRHLQEGSSAVIRVTSTSPSGVVDRLARAEITVGRRPYGDLPGNLAFAVPITFEAAGYGRYQIECSIEVTDGPSLAGQAGLWLLPKADAPQT